MSNILVVGEEYVKDLLDHVTFSRAIASLFRGMRTSWPTLSELIETVCNLARKILLVFDIGYGSS